MSQHVMFGIVAVLLFAIGFYGLLAFPHLLRKIISINIMSTGVFLLLITLHGAIKRSFPILFRTQWY